MTAPANGASHQAQPLRRVRHDVPAPYDGMLTAYAAALADSPLAISSRAVYLRRVRGYLAWVATASARGLLAGEPLADTIAAVRTAHAYHGQLDGRYAPRTINGMLAAVEDFHTRLRLGATGVPRERAPITEPDRKPSALGTLVSTSRSGF
ncbi:hypothetical protein ACIBO2_58070 [Nonomuraea sp. NPDC050022]|uniref:hypothetical protein n=1 Tax=unclassified Nonomuraea TaxID=2593643 RepID=UPI00340D0AE7